MTDLAAVVAAHRVLVCVGSGGVGKTTTAAALALWGALQGRRTAVVTIDPSKRLADCLGLNSSGVGETSVPPEIFTCYGLTPTGSLTALLVDQQSAWDAAVERYAPTPETRDRILANRFYQGLSRTFAGSHEFMALDTLATLLQGGTYDLIVLDTPPVQQALEFLEAPMRLQKFLDSRMSKWLMRPTVERGWAALSAANRTTTFLLRKVESATGISALGEIAEFFTAMHGMFEDFGVRFSRVSALLASQETAFLLITSPDEEVLQEAGNFRVALERMGIALKAVVVNRVHEPWRIETNEKLNVKILIKRMREVLCSFEDEATLQWLVENFLAYQALAQSEKERVQKFSHHLSAVTPIVYVPVLQRALVDLQGLAALHSYLFAEESAPARSQTQ
jgi:anion-transporting  ArsA/GET3 family ATPase